MGRRSKTALYIGADVMTLQFRASVLPSPNPPTVVLRLDGVVLDRLVLRNGTVDSADYAVTVRPERGRIWSVLTIEIDQTFVPSQAGQSTDDRELGLRIHELSWVPGQGSSPTTASRDRFLGAGWGSLETDGKDSWRWTKDRAVVHLPPVEGDGHLALKMLVPEQSDGRPSTVTIEVGGQVFDRFQPPIGLFTKTYRIPAALHGSAPFEVTLSAEPVPFPSDHQSGSIRVFHLGWLPSAAP
jgi:hypothetical protein